MSMTEEQIAALNEQIERLTEQVGYMVSAMESITRVNNTYTKSVKDAATATEDLKDSIETSSTALETEAKVKKQAEQREAANERIYASARNAVAGFADALTSGQRGFSVFSGSVTSSGEALSELTDQYGIHGQILSQLIKATTVIINAQLTQADNLFKARTELFKFAGATTISSTELLDLGNNLGFTSSQLDSIIKPLRSMGPSLLSLGNSAGEGAKRFLQLSDVTDETRKRFIRMGVMPEELLQSQADYINLQRISGNQASIRLRTDKQLLDESLKYTENLKILSELTGEDAETIKKRQEAALNDFRLQAKITQMNATAAALEETGIKEDADRAAAIRNNVKNIQDNIAAMSALSPELADQAKSLILTEGVITNFTSNLAIAGVDVQKFYRSIMEENDPSAGLRFFQDVMEKTGDQAIRFGDIVQFLSDESLNTIGINRGSMDLLTKYMNEGQSLTEAFIKAREGLEGIEGRDPLANAQATLITTQMNLSSGFDSLLARTNPLISGFSTTTIAATTLAGAAAIAAMQLAKIGAGSVLNRFGGGSGGVGGTDLSMDTRGARALSGLKTGGLLAALGVATEAYSGFQTHQQIDRQREQGLITEQEAEEQQSRNIKTAGGRAVGATTGALVGGAVGQAMIPIPVVGAMIGSSIGSMLGTAAGEWAGDYFADKAEAAQEESATRTQTPRTPSSLNVPRLEVSETNATGGTQTNVTTLPPTAVTQTPRTPSSPNVPRLEVSETNASGGTQTNVPTVPPTAVTQQTRIENREQHELLSTMVSEMRDMNYKLDQLNYTNLTLSRQLAS